MSQPPSLPPREPGSRRLGRPRRVVGPPVRPEPYDSPAGLVALVERRIRTRNLSPRTAAAYVRWIQAFIRHTGRRDPSTLAKPEIEGFLSSLAVERKVAAATQNQALAALLFLYREVLGLEFPWLDDLVRAKRPKRLLECLQLRVKDLDFDRREIHVREGKGQRERPTMLSTRLCESIGTHLEMVRINYCRGRRHAECKKRNWNA